MTDVKRLLPAFSDERGDIIDIFSKAPKDHCALISFTRGSKRADHYHKLSTQFTYVVSGTLAMRTADVDLATGQLIVKTLKEHEIHAGDFVEHKPYEAHAFLSKENSTILAFACGLRGGDDYERDVYRLPKSLFQIDI